MAKRVLALGDLVLDIIAPVTLPVVGGAHQDITGMRIEPGGMGNFAAAARHMGLGVDVLGTVGDDLFGQRILEDLQAEGVDTGLVVITPGSTSTVVVAMADLQSGEHVFIGQYGQGAAPELPPLLDEKIKMADALFLVGYSFLETWLQGLIRYTVEAATAAGVPIFFDVGPSFSQAPAEQVAWITQHAAVILMTEEEVPFISEGRTGQQACDFLLSQNPDTLVIKRGPDGCQVATAAGMEEVPGFAVQVVDTIGAGDCFAAAFIAGRLAGLGDSQSALLANAMGAATVKKAGAGRSAPTCEEIKALLRESAVEIEVPC